MVTIPEGKAVVLFDGMCNLCSDRVQFIIKRDKKDYFVFASLQSEIGQELAKGLEKTTDSIVLLENDKLFVKAEAALRIAKHLGQPWTAISTLRVLPNFLLNGVYTLIANNRYRWWGKKNSCWMPTAELKVKFL